MHSRSKYLFLHNSKLNSFMNYFIRLSVRPIFVSKIYVCAEKILFISGQVQMQEQQHQQQQQQLQQQQQQPPPQQQQPQQQQPQQPPVMGPQDVDLSQLNEHERNHIQEVGLDGVSRNPCPITCFTLYKINEQCLWNILCIT